MTSICQLIYDVAYNALVGSNPPTYVATFGNTPVEQVGDWVKILDNLDPSGATVS